MRRALINVFLALSVLASHLCFAETRLPSSLGNVRLGEIPSETSLLPVAADATAIRAASRIRDLKPGIAIQMSGALLPAFRSSRASGSITLYEGRVVSINLFVPDVQFKSAHQAAFSRFGKASSQKSRVSDVSAGCEPYMLDQWVSGRLALFLVADERKTGVSAYLRDNDLNYKMSTDDSVHTEYEQCIEF